MGPAPVLFFFYFLYRAVRFAVIQYDEYRAVYTFTDKTVELIVGILIVIWWRKKKDWLVHFYWLACVKLFL